MKFFSECRTLLAGVAMGAAMSLPVAAQDNAQQETLLAQAQMTPAEVALNLEADGYVVFEQRRTLLGRVMLRAERGSWLREVVIDPRTGEVLRDMITERGNGTTSAAPGGEARATARQIGAGAGVGQNSAGELHGGIDGQIGGGMAPSAAGGSGMDGRAGNNTGASIEGSIGRGSGASIGIGASIGGIGGSIGGSVGGNAGRGRD